MGHGRERMVLVRAAPNHLERFSSSYLSSSMAVIFFSFLGRNVGDQKESLMSLNPVICQLREEITAGEKAICIFI